MNFSVAIPTYKRPDALRTTVASLLENTRVPNELLIIDDGELSQMLITELTQECTRKRISFAHHNKAVSGLRRGLSESKNWAAELAHHDVLFFLDDDVVLDAHYFEKIMQAWKEYGEDEKLIGIGGKITNNRKQSWFEKKIFNPLFGLTGEYAWDVNDVGFQVWDESVSETQRAYYIHGGVSSYRRSYVREEPFTVFSGGRTALEDVEHCLRAKKRGLHFFYVPSACLKHYPQAVAREAAFEAGKKETQNRRAIFKLHCKQDVKHKLWFLLASKGWVLKKLVALKFHEVAGMLIK